MEANHSSSNNPSLPPNEPNSVGGQGPLATPEVGSQMREKIRGSADGAQRLFELAMDYYTGRDGKKDVPLAIRIFEDAAAAGSMAAAHQLAQSMLDGSHPAREMSKPIEALTALADRGHAASQYSLGLLCFAGARTPRDPERAKELLQKAAEQGHPGARATLGNILVQGLGVPKERNRGVALLKEASRDGVGSASLHLGKFLLAAARSPAQIERAGRYLHNSAARAASIVSPDLQGAVDATCGLPNKSKAAFPLIDKAAEQGDRLALRHAGLAYLIGRGVEPDSCKAKSCYEDAARVADPVASGKLADISLQQARGKSERAKAVFWYAKAAVGPDVVSKCQLGLEHLRDCKEERQAFRGVELLTEAALAGHLESQFELAEIFRGRALNENVRRFVPKDPEMAIRWYREAAETFHPFAAFCAAEMCLNGEGVEKDIKQARRFLKLASRHGLLELSLSIQANSFRAKYEKNSNQILDFEISLMKEEQRDIPAIHRLITKVVNFGREIRGNIREAVRLVRNICSELPLIRGLFGEPPED